MDPTIKENLTVCTILVTTHIITTTITTIDNFGSTKPNDITPTLMVSQPSGTTTSPYITILVTFTSVKIGSLGSLTCLPPLWGCKPYGRSSIGASDLTHLTSQI
ncbi:hypothetical protein ES288_D01G185400v1 [Gossypium darwinii]|uniref:Uncharacterized protein n=1 Tax=Gossypium darwinii TaxID=34276 RepID=A0A5D2DR66_GOSDA|nr:hypothetical protein ES288_D01G185400v1 [Gossypium darwinii]